MRTTTPILAALVLTNGIALGANAATLTVTADKATYAVGDIITLSVSADSLPTETTFGIFGQLNFDQNLATGISSVQTPMVSTYYVGMPINAFVTAPWIQGVTPITVAYGTGLAIAFNQIAPVPTLPAGTSADPNPNLGLVKLRADAPGTVDVTWATSPSFQALLFFGLTNAPGTSFDIVAVPEPASAPFIGYCIVGLVLAARGRGGPGRRRRSWQRGPVDRNAAEWPA